MIKNQKWLFLYALILTFIIFNVGIFMGYKLEASRLNKINDLYASSEIMLLDQRIQSEILNMDDFNCEILTKENIAFADKIFEEALQIQRFEDANRITTDVIQAHRRFDLLRTLFWMNSIKIKEKCKSEYHNVVYFYRYNNPSLEQVAEQRFFSNLLLELKGKYGDKLMLIPIAADNDISSISILLDKYNVTELPTILIDEKTKIIQVNSLQDVEKFLN
jgi:hypothetical protein